MTYVDVSLNNTDKYLKAKLLRSERLLLHVSPTYNVLRHMYIVFPDDLAKGKRFSWWYSSCSYCSCCGSCGYCSCSSCVVPVVV